MNCYDCATQDHLNRSAVAVCHDCGAAVCDEHAVLRSHYLVRLVPLTREIPVEPAARVVRCTTCDAAYATLHNQPARTPHKARTAVA
jgi:hypothetical protein